MKYAAAQYRYGFSVWFFGVLSAAILSLIIAAPAHAQLSVGGQGFVLKTQPSFPEPHAPVTVRIDDYSVHAIGAEVVWSVDGTERTDLRDERSITLDAGALGETQEISATLIRSDGSRVSASTTIAPTVLDLVLEADTYVPSFYKGRALPGRTSLLRATAVVHDGAANDTVYTYRWTLGQDVLFGGPVRGKQTVSFPMPIYTQTLTVEVMDPEGHLVARQSMTPRSVQPELHFYEWSPLKGLYQNAIAGAFPLVGEEATLFGEPYFVNAAPTHQNAEIAWTSGGRTIPSDTESARALTVSRTIVGQESRVALRILTQDTVPQLLEESLNIIAY